MADNTVLNAGAGGDTIREVEKAGAKTQVILLDLGGLGVESLFTGAVTVASGTISLPAGASTSALQTTGNTSLGNIDTKTPALGQALAAVSVPIVLTALQQTALTPPAAITGFALEAGHLAAVDTSTAKIPAQGQALAAASMPVVLTAAQIITLTPPAAITGFATDTTLAGRLKPADTLAGVTTVAAVTAITNALPAGTNTLGGALDVPDATATYASSNADSTALETSHIVKASAGVLYGFSGYNSKTSAQFIQVHNSATLPADTAVPLITFIVQAGSNFSFDTGRFGKFFSAGIVICNSSTAATKTIGAADCWFNPVFK